MLLTLFPAWYSALAGTASGSGKKRKSKVIVDGELLELNPRQLAQLLNKKQQEARQKVETAPVDTPAPVVTLEVAVEADEAIYGVIQQVDRTNEIILRIWQEAMLRRMQEEDDEECLMLCL